MIQLKCCTFPSGWISQYSEHIDQLVGVRLVERHAIAEPEMMHNAVAGSSKVRTCIWPASWRVRKWSNRNAWSRLDTNDVNAPSLDAGREGGGVGARAFDNDDRQVGMLLAKLFEPAAGGVPLAVVLGLTVLLDDRLGCQWDDFLEVRDGPGWPPAVDGNR